MFGVLIAGSLIGFALGALNVMAGAMSDAPAEGDASAKAGFISCIICVILFIFAFVGRHYGWLH